METKRIMIEDRRNIKDEELAEAAAVLKSGGNPLQNVLGSLGGLQSSIQTEWKKQEKDFQQFGKDVCSRVVTLEDSRKALVGNLK